MFYACDSVIMASFIFFIHPAKNKIKKAESYWQQEHLPHVHIMAKLLHIFKNLT